jgi:hypothetical protein
MQTTFDWCSIEQPEAATLGEPLSITIDIQRVPSPSKLNAYLRYHTGNRSKTRRIHSDKHLIEISETGPVVLTFEIPDIETMRALQLRAYLTTTGKRKGRVTQVIKGPPISLIGADRARLPVKSNETTATSRKRDWKISIHDPSVAGWGITIAYLVASLFCLRSALHSRRVHPYRLSILWWLLSVMLLFLAVNKQLDLQTLLTDIGREWAHRGGWYDQRRAIQYQAILISLTLGLAGMGITLYWIRGVWHRLWLALVGVALLASFVILRAASIHHTGRLLGLRLGEWHFLPLLEVIGAALVGFSAWRHVRTLKREHRPAAPK